MSELCQRAFEKFHEKNPHVYAILERLARQMAKRRTTLSISQLWEVMRWEIAMTTSENMSNPDDPEKTLRLNNNHRAYYARLLMDEIPELSGRFNTRTV